MIDTGLAQGGEGSRITTGLGEEMAPVAEHVSPPVEPQGGGGRMLAQVPAGRDEPLVVWRAGQCGNRGWTVDGPMRKPGGTCGLGGVFGDVVRHRLSRQRPAGMDDPGVDLGPKPQDTPQVRVCGGYGGRVV